MREPGVRFAVGSAALCLTPPAPCAHPGRRPERSARARPTPAANGAPSGHDRRRDEGDRKRGAVGAPASRRSGHQPQAGRGSAQGERGPRRPRLETRGPQVGGTGGGWGNLPSQCGLRPQRWHSGCTLQEGAAPGPGRSPHSNANLIRLHCATERGGAEREGRSRGGPGGGHEAGANLGARASLPKDSSAAACAGHLGEGASGLAHWKVKH